MLPRLRFFVVTLAALLLFVGVALHFLQQSPRASGLSIGMRSAMGSPLDLALGENMQWREQRHALLATLRADELARLRDLPAPVIPAAASEPPPVFEASVSSGPDKSAKKSNAETVPPPQAKVEATIAIEAPAIAPAAAPIKADTPAPEMDSHASVEAVPEVPVVAMPAAALSAPFPPGSQPDISGAEETTFRSARLEDLIDAPVLSVAVRNGATKEPGKTEPAPHLATAPAEATPDAAAEPSPPLPEVMTEDTHAMPAAPLPSAHKAVRTQTRASRQRRPARTQARRPVASAAATGTPFILPSFDFGTFTAQPKRQPRRQPAPRTRTTSPAPSFYAGPGAMPLSR